LGCELELGVGDGLAISVPGSQLAGLELFETVEWLDSRKGIDAEQLYFPSVLVSQTREHMREH